MCSNSPIHKKLRCSMINETILAIIIAFAISALLCPIVIPFLHKLKFGQQVRDDGPQAHLKKQGTVSLLHPFFIFPDIPKSYRFCL